jgi:hypothetical protein
VPDDLDAFSYAAATLGAGDEADPAQPRQSALGAWRGFWDDEKDVLID